MKPPATAGLILDESKIRAFMKCSKYYDFGGDYEFAPQLSILKEAFERLIATALRKDIENPSFMMAQSINKSVYSEQFRSYMLDQQVDQLSRDILFMANDLLTYFKLNKYHIVTAQLPFRLRISKTPIDFNVSAVFKNKKTKQIHFVDFTPYSDYHSIDWDIPTILKLKFLNKFVPSSAVRDTDVVAHIFGAGDHTTKLRYHRLTNKDVKTSHLKQAKVLIQNMETGYALPRIPCYYKCQFKEQCIPKG